MFLVVLRVRKRAGVVDALVKSMHAYQDDALLELSDIVSQHLIDGTQVGRGMVNERMRMLPKALPKIPKMLCVSVHYNIVRKTSQSPCKYSRSIHDSCYMSFCCYYATQHALSPALNSDARVVSNPARSSVSPVTPKPRRHIPRTPCTTAVHPAATQSSPRCTTALMAPLSPLGLPLCCTNRSLRSRCCPSTTDSIVPSTATVEPIAVLAETKNMIMI